MGKVIAIAIQKGGVGKTTTAINLSACVAEKGKKVLVIDIDPQGNTTTGFGIEKNELQNTIYELMLGEVSVKECIIPNVIENLPLSLIPSNINLAAAEIELIDQDRKEYVLKNELDWIKDQYDYIFIDCPPSLSMLTINAMTAADSILVPIQCEYYAMEGLGQLIHTANLIKKKINPGLSMEGFVFTMYDSRTNLSEEVVQMVKEAVDEHIFETVIPRIIKMFESDTKGWHGSYSLMGKISAESFPMVLNKEKILKGLYKPKKIKDNLR